VQGDKFTPAITVTDSGSPFQSVTSKLNLKVATASTKVALRSSAPSSAVGQSVTYTAKVTDSVTGVTPTGAVAFDDSGKAIPTCPAQPVVATTASATCKVSYSAIGSHAVTAIYTGDKNFSTSTSVVLTEQVTQDHVRISVVPTPNPGTHGQAVSIQATLRAAPPGLGTPTGKVTFLAANVAVPGCVAINLGSQNATCTTTFAKSGTVKLSVIYSGDTHFLPGRSAPVVETIG